MRAEPVAERRAAKTLGTVLRGLGYSEDAVVELLGDEAYGSDRKEAPAAERRLPPTPLGTAIRALFLQLPVDAADAERAFGRKGLDALEATGLASVRGELEPGARVLPVGDLLVAADGDPDADGDDPPDYVAPYTPTSRTCDFLTPRRHFDRALDVGTGSGVQALLAARHAGQVVATDVNERALTFGRLNAALNDLSNVDFRAGSLFEPVAGETFDLITCNAPFVISPENQFVYRDAGFEGDGVTERVVRAAGAHLADDGYATLLGSWLGHDEDTADDRPLAWSEGLGCDRWLISFRMVDPLDHAAAWNAPIAGDAKRFGAALDRWLEYFTRLDAHLISEGAILLHRRDAPTHTLRIDEVDESGLDDAGDQIERAFANRVRLAGLGRSRELPRRGSHSRCRSHSSGRSRRSGTANRSSSTRRSRCGRGRATCSRRPPRSWRRSLRSTVAPRSAEPSERRPSVCSSGSAKPCACAAERCGSPANCSSSAHCASPRRHASGMSATAKLSDEQLKELLELTKGADTVELKLTVPHTHRTRGGAALGIDPLDAQIRQVYFFDTPDLALNRAGLVVRARRVQGKGDDSVVKLRPVIPDELPAELRASPNFGVEVDAMPGGFVARLR